MQTYLYKDREKGMSNILNVENIKKIMLIHHCPLLDTGFVLSERQQSLSH